MDDQAGVERVQQIRRTLEERDTEDLLEIWRKNDHDEWTSEAFEAVRQILIARNETIPDQDDIPVVRNETAPDQDEISEPDTYYDRESMIRLAGRAKNLSRFMITLFVIILVLEAITFVQGWSSSNFRVENMLLYLIAVMIPFALCGFFWILLQVIAESIYIFMDIEENTRLSMKAKGK